ncbi:efflux RND transporter periplasmic adaptor subunit [Aquabacterium sp. A08]|uniref:efflux RND transporter periplasmic adaptor subunit n=1 Tax=Aquabacterium sp. A08 TaxID=2718532 RepID=UPI0014236C40|nr:efflux RND transporter periplasmic adaptor subunit [Aquabacterium sp. A08]NIC43367.1 efflux RND transporter periplasmic adaptor subunit [Aquabacterium sp. A08]
MKPTDASPATDVQTLLGADRPPRWWQRPLWWGGTLAVAVLVGGGYAYQSRQAQQAAPGYVTENLRRGDLTLTVSANGTLQPTRLVNVGSELSGTVREVLVDVNDRVKKGQVLVVLDTAKLTDQVHSARAALVAAQAQVAQAAATLKEAQAQRARQEDVFQRSGGQVPSAAELDGARAAVDRAQAAEASARAAVQQAQANLATNETNLSKASIRSPIDGVVLTRAVDPGNAVAASLQAVTLFSIAESLGQLRLEVYVDEADVGAVQVGQAASFTVSAYPTRRYPATIARVAFGSTKTENVVTYVTTLDVDNQDLSLRPGMTANASIVATERKGVLVVPNAALRFTPSNGNGAAAGNPSVLSRMMPRPPSTASKTARPEGRGGARQIWVLQNGQPQALPVTGGISDGRYTEVSGDGLTEGLAVITGQLSAGAAR